MALAGLTRAPAPAVRWRGPLQDVRAQASYRTCLRLMTCYAFFLPVQLGTSVSLRLAVSDLFVAVYVVRRGSHLRRVARGWSSWTYALTAVLWGGLLVALVRTGSVSQGAVLAKAVGLLVLLAGFAALLDVAVDWSALRAVLRAFLLGVLVNVTAALLAYALLRTTGVVLPLMNAPYEATRLTGLLIDPNAFGGIIATALVLHLATTAAGASLLPGGWRRFADVVLPLGLLLTFSRSAWIGATAGCLLVLLAAPRVLTRMVRRTALPAVLGIVLASAWLPSFSSLVSRPGQVTARVSIADEALAEFVADPAFGTGLGVFSTTHGVIVHNSVLWFLTELGLVGLVVFLAFLLVHAGKGWWVVQHVSGAPRALALGMLAGVGVGLGVSVGIEAVYQRYWWLMIAGTASAYALSHAEAP